jgi:hypothetical protein
MGNDPGQSLPKAGILQIIKYNQSNINTLLSTIVRVLKKAIQAVCYRSKATEIFHYLYLRYKHILYFYFTKG